MKNVKKLLMSSCAVLALFACESTPPHYDLCVFYNSLDKIYCNSSNPKVSPYDAKPSTDYVLMPIDDYKGLYKYAKQVQKELERCKK